MLLPHHWATAAELRHELGCLGFAVLLGKTHPNGLGATFGDCVVEDSDCFLCFLAFVEAARRGRVQKREREREKVNVRLSNMNIESIEEVEIDSEVFLNGKVSLDIEYTYNYNYRMF